MEKRYKSTETSLITRKYVQSIGSFISLDRFFIAAAGAFFQVNIVKNHYMYIHVFTFFFVLMAVAGAFFPVNVVEKRETYKKSRLYTLSYTDFGCMFLQF